MILSRHTTGVDELRALTATQGTGWTVPLAIQADSYALIISPFQVSSILRVSSSVTSITN